MRSCDRCGAGMNDRRPRVRVNQQMWCQTCAKDTTSPSGKYKPGSDIRTTASDWHAFDTNRHYRRGHQDGAQGVYDQDHDHLSAKVDMGIPLEPHEVDYMAGHAAGTQRAREHAQAQHDMKAVWEQHGQHYSLKSLEPRMAIKIALREQKTGQRLFVLAHDSGDGETIYHCPFCGSGQVIARSDRTIECEFCHTSFTVQVQPEYSAFPQTMDGQPVQVPGMPGQIDAPVGGSPADPSIAAPDSDGDGIPDQQGFDPAAAASAQNQPPWLTAGLKTQAGKVLPVEEYVHHLALKHAGEKRTAVLRRVRASREFT